MKGRTIDLSESHVNIDSLLDVYITEQKANGVDHNMVECDIEIDNDGTITKRKTKNKPCEKSCQGCETTPKRKGLGLFGQDQQDDIDDDDDDDTYICEYCSDIGYRKEYNPILCDTCTVCETCSEFEAKECSGCTYSVYRTGETYSSELAKTGQKPRLDEEEQAIVDDINSDMFGEMEVRKSDLSFTIMDYDHSYK